MQLSYCPTWKTIEGRTQPTAKVVLVAEKILRLAWCRLVSRGCSHRLRSKHFPCSTDKQQRHLFVRKILPEMEFYFPPGRHHFLFPELFQKRRDGSYIHCYSLWRQS